MVGAVTGSGFSALNYLNQIKGISATNPVSSQSATDTTDTTDSSVTKPTSTTLPPTPSLSAILGIPSNVLSLLQNVSSTSANGGLVSTLTGGYNIASGPLTGIYNTLLYTSSSVVPLQNAANATEQQQTQAKAQTSPVQNLLNDYINASNAYNQTLQQNAKAVLAANSFGANGTTPLVA